MAHDTTGMKKMTGFVTMSAEDLKVLASEIAEQVKTDNGCPGKCALDEKTMATLKGMAESWEKAKSLAFGIFVAAVITAVVTAIGKGLLTMAKGG